MLPRPVYPSGLIVPAQVAVFLNLTTQVWISISPNAWSSGRCGPHGVYGLTSLFSANFVVPPATCKPLKIGTGQLLPALFQSASNSASPYPSRAVRFLPGSNGLRNFDLPMRCFDSFPGQKVVVSGRQSLQIKLPILIRGLRLEETEIGSPSRPALPPPRFQLPASRPVRNISLCALTQLIVISSAGFGPFETLIIVFNKGLSVGVYL